jgi:hypothetical protein
MKFLNTLQDDSHFGAIKVDTDAGTITFDMKVSDKHEVTIGASRILATTNDNDGQTFMVTIIQGGGGSFSVTWWSGIQWPGGVPPTLTTTAGKADVFSFIRRSSGVYYGFVVGQNL